MDPKSNNIVSILSNQLSSAKDSDKTLCLCDLCSEPGKLFSSLLMFMTPMKLTDVLVCPAAPPPWCAEPVQ